MHPITGHGALEGKYRYSSTLSLTLVLDEDGWSLQGPVAKPPDHPTCNEPLYQLCHPCPPKPLG
jgi:hypothetical protein